MTATAIHWFTQADNQRPIRTRPPALVRPAINEAKIGQQVKQMERTFSPGQQLTLF